MYSSGSTSCRATRRARCAARGGSRAWRAGREYGRETGSSASTTTSCVLIFASDGPHEGYKTRTWYVDILSCDQVIRENPASRGTETSAEVLVGPPLGAGGWSETPVKVRQCSLPSLLTYFPVLLIYLLSVCLTYLPTVFWSYHVVRQYTLHSALVLVLGTNIAVLLDCSKSSRQCSLPSLLPYLLGKEVNCKSNKDTSPDSGKPA